MLWSLRWWLARRIAPEPIQAKPLGLSVTYITTVSAVNAWPDAYTIGLPPTATPPPS